MCQTHLSLVKGQIIVLLPIWIWLSILLNPEFLLVNAAELASKNSSVLQFYNQQHWTQRAGDSSEAYRTEEEPELELQVVITHFVDFDNIINTLGGCPLL